MSFYTRSCQSALNGEICSLCHSSLQIPAIHDDTLVFHDKHVFHRFCMEQWICQCFERDEPLSCPTCQWEFTQINDRLIVEEGMNCKEIMDRYGPFLGSMVITALIRQAQQKHPDLIFFDPSEAAAAPPQKTG